MSQPLPPARGARPGPTPVQASSLPLPPCVPALDFLDPSIIPSLPPPGGHVGHAALMGRPRIISPDPLHMRIGDVPPPVPPKEDSLKVKPGMIRRSSSFEERRGNRAGVGAGTGKGHGRNWSISTGGTEGLSMPRPEIVRRTSSFENPPQSKNSERKVVKGHARTATDSTVDMTITPRGRSGTLMPFDRHHTRSTSAGRSIEAFQGCIKLGSERDLPQASKLLLTLHALIPPSRTPTPPPPPPNSGMIHPSTLLTPLAIILEALVVERTILRTEYDTAQPRLPVLRDGSAFQLAAGDGELDWRVTKTYIVAVGQILTSLLPYLQDHRNSKEVEGLTKGLRVYVGKMKKVFGEVAGMYVEGYGFVRGLWDEGGMKGAAGEVGRWGDFFDA